MGRSILLQLPELFASLEVHVNDVTALQGPQSFKNVC